MTKDDFNNFLRSIEGRGVHRGLERVQHAAHFLSDPQNSLRIIHIAGTNGKGTTCFFLAQILAMQGFKVGLYLSPHVIDYSERIQILDINKTTDFLSSQNWISDAELLHVHQKMLVSLPPDIPLTYFEWTTLLAFQYFADQKVDFVVLETGLGGRWDATNICPSILTGITSIGLDHTHILGDTPEAILAEKLEIIKPQQDFLFFTAAAEQAHLVEQAKSFCQKKQTRFWQKEGLLQCDQKDKAILQAFIDKTTSYLQNNLAFAFALAILLQKQGHPLDFSRLLPFSSFKILFGRLEKLSEHPVILLDGAHNEQGLLVLRQYLLATFGEEYDLAFACLNDRDFNALAKIVRSSHQNYWVRLDTGFHRAHQSAAYECVQAELGGEIVQLDASFHEKVKKFSTHRPLVVCGSLYFLTEFRHFWRHT